MEPPAELRTHRIGILAAVTSVALLGSGCATTSTPQQVVAAPVLRLNKPKRSAKQRYPL